MSEKIKDFWELENPRFSSNSKNIQKKLKDLDKIGFVDFTDSPFSKIIAKQNHINNIISIASKKLNTNKNTPIAKGIKIELRTWKKFIQRNYIKSLTYSRLNKFCDVSINDSRKGIEFIDEIKDPNLPFNFDSKEGARLDVGVFNEGRMRDRIVEYSNKDNEVLSRILQCSKKVLGKKFNPKMGVDKRSNTNCIYFPPIFAKHFSKLGFTEKNKNQCILRIPFYIMDNEKYQKIWWQGNLSEEASIYSLVYKKGNSFYINPRIQLNRVKSVNLSINHFKKETTYYCKHIPEDYLRSLKLKPIKLMLDETNILKTFNIILQPYFSKLYVNKLNQTTATYTIMLYRLQDLENYAKNIGFELKRHKKQLKLLLNARGGHSKNQLRDIIVKFYKLVPTYLRGIKKIDENKWITKEDKKELLGDENA